MSESKWKIVVTFKVYKRMYSNKFDKDYNFLDILNNIFYHTDIYYYHSNVICYVNDDYIYKYVDDNGNVMNDNKDRPLKIFENIIKNGIKNKLPTCYDNDDVYDAVSGKN